jgi:putative beta-lysine N-acetyltransferase
VGASAAVSSALFHADWANLYSKILVYARPGQDGWPELGLRREAVIWSYFADGADAELWAAYSLPMHRRDLDERKADRVIALAGSKRPIEPTLPAGYACAVATAADAPEIADLMARTFTDYPVPFSAGRIAAAIEARSSHFRVVRFPYGGIVACAAAEMQACRRAARITDCATREDQRRKGLMTCLVRALERDLVAKFGIHAVFSIARACEPGINCCLAKLGYRYTGRLVNHSCMPNGQESMNVWCRELRGAVASL